MILQHKSLVALERKMFATLRRASCPRALTWKCLSLVLLGTISYSWHLTMVTSNGNRNNSYSINASDEVHNNDLRPTDEEWIDDLHSEYDFQQSAPEGKPLPIAKETTPYPVSTTIIPGTTQKRFLPEKVPPREGSTQRRFLPEKVPLREGSSKRKFLPEVNRIMYNRVPKCGSSAFKSVIRALAIRNNFTFASSSIYGNVRGNEESQREVCQLISSLPPPAMYDRHYYYVNCTQWGFPRIDYINLVRDPIEREASHFSFVKYGFLYKDKTGRLTGRYNQTYSECVLNGQCNGQVGQIRFFCGHDRICSSPSSEAEVIQALAQAKLNVDKSYLVIGITENMEIFLRLLEKLLPHYFAAALDIFVQSRNSLSKKYSTRQKEEVSNAALKILRRTMRFEYEFYYFIKKKFYAMAEQHELLPSR